MASRVSILRGGGGEEALPAVANTVSHCNGASFTECFLIQLASTERRALRCNFYLLKSVSCKNSCICSGENDGMPCPRRQLPRPRPQPNKSPPKLSSSDLKQPARVGGAGVEGLDSLSNLILKMQLQAANCGKIRLRCDSGLGHTREFLLRHLRRCSRHLPTPTQHPHHPTCTCTRHEYCLNVETMWL
jgi:hypothetical protein